MAAVLLGEWLVGVVRVVSPDVMRSRSASYSFRLPQVLTMPKRALRESTAKGGAVQAFARRSHGSANFLGLRTRP